MILDALLNFSDAQALTSSGGSTNVVDLGETKNLFDGKGLGVLVSVDVAADASSGDETYTFKLQCDDNSGFSSATDVTDAKSVARGTLAAGYKFVIPIPVGVSVERYLRVYYTLGGTTPSVTVSAYLTDLNAIDKYTVYAKNYTIS